MAIRRHASKIFNKSILAITITCTSLTVSADFIEDSSLKLKLKNEYRRADRPSADAPYGPKIDAWVQGYLFDFSSGKINDKISIDASLYHTQKLAADEDKSTRFYLDGHDSATIGGVSINLDLADWAQFKIGQFGTDYLHGSLDHMVPLIDHSSNRTDPTMAEGILWRGDFADNIHLYGMVSTKEAGKYKKSWQDTGLIGFVDGAFVTVDEKTTYNFAALWQTAYSNLKFGWQGMDDQADQFQVEAGHTWAMPFNSMMRAESRFYYAKTKGYSKDTYAPMTGGNDDTFLASAVAWWMLDQWTLTGAIGQAGNKLLPVLEIDTDIGYVFDQSIDRNGQDMFSWQLGVMYDLTPSLKIGGLVTFTDGYEDYTKTVKQEGIGGTLLLMHKVKEGELKGLETTFVYSNATEDRKGVDGHPDSQRGGNLDYYDIMLKVHYPVDIF
ncbi:OprD family outer membrane porin [Salinisphaera sp. G21_0]|uniref:OprD family outer membrane porin n=1 Tax=Salinisphaera sp. G21_0 TaxID=2821094 RepID=UPI001AD9BDC4|nr:OprD family outer membrane porin [Salinisphaera sp. G21_0]MBO9482905.1 OprD family outer membrane porin [Salinisphaera sp. G21_0]